MLRLAASCTLILFASTAEARRPRLVSVDFGYLQLATRDVPYARSIGLEVQRTARDVLGLVQVRFLIVDRSRTKFSWGDTTSSGLPVYPWSFAHGAIDVSVQPPDHILTHEIGHDLFKRYLMPSTHPGQYGTDAPDWLDEAVAVAFEAPEQKAERRCQAFHHLRSGTLLLLAQFLTMDHPDLEATPTSIDPGRAQQFGFLPSVSPETPAFYAMSLAFHEYLVDRSGSVSILGQIARAARSGERAVDVVFAHVKGADTRGEMSRLDSDFKSWLGATYRSRCL